MSDREWVAQRANADAVDAILRGIQTASARQIAESIARRYYVTRSARMRAWYIRCFMQTIG